MHVIARARIRYPALPAFSTPVLRAIPRGFKPLSPPSPTPFLAAAYVAALLGLAGLPVPAFAQAGAEIAERRSDLDELKKRIRDLQDEMAKAEADRSSAQKALAESERAVSRAARDLAKVEGERKAAEKQLALLEGEQRETAARIEARRGDGSPNGCVADYCARRSRRRRAAVVGARSQPACP